MAVAYSAPAGCREWSHGIAILQHIYDNFGAKCATDYNGPVSSSSFIPTDCSILPCDFTTCTQTHFDFLRENARQRRTTRQSGLQSRDLSGGCVCLGAHRNSDDSRVRSASTSSSDVDEKVKVGVRTRRPGPEPEVKVSMKVR